MEKKIFIPCGTFSADDALLKAKREALKQKLLSGGKVTLKKDGNVTSDGDSGSSISIPKGKLAVNASFVRIPEGELGADDALLKAKREALKQKLLSGGKVTLKKDGNVTSDGDSGSSISIPKGKLAVNASFVRIPKGKLGADDALLKAKREALKQRLLSGDKVTLKKDGNVTSGGDSGSSISIPKGKLAAPWYVRDPQLFEAEKVAMSLYWPNFKLYKLDDGRLYWQGELCPGIYETKYGTRKKYTVMAVYNDNHPEQEMGSSVKIYPVLPDVDDIINECGFRPYHLLRDSNGCSFLCTNDIDDVKVGNTVTTAASVLAWAVKWFACYELVLTGDLTKEKFNQHGGV